jgi:fumarate reductase flavoprotein subunit
MTETPRVVRADTMPAGTPACRVAIVGAGACGLAAACFLRDAGIDDVVVVERDAAPGGSSALSSGFIPAAGTRVQRAAGVLDDDAARFANDIQRKAHGQAAPHLVRAYTRVTADAIDALGERHGLTFELLDGFLYPGHTRARMHTLAARTGAALVGALTGAAEAAGAMLVTQARAVELWCDGEDRVIGLGFERPDGALEHLACRALLLACNGFGGNAALVREHLPALADAAFAGHRGNDGSALAWGRALGARTADLGAAQGHGSWAVPQGVLVTWAPMTQGAIQVNARGERFHDETGGYSEAAAAVLAQPGGIAWNVFDARLLALARGFPDFREAEAAGACREAENANALAALIGCDSDVLARTLAATQLEAPYTAIKVTGALFHTQGGLDIDARCRVLRERDGAPLPNLLAAGGAARGVSGRGIDGYLSGNGLLSALAGAWIAARMIDEESLA